MKDMNRKILIVLAALLIMSTGCVSIFKYVKSGGPGKYLPPRAEIKFTGKPTGLDSLIRIDGMYINESYVNPVKFYPDGRAYIDDSYGLYKVKGDSIIVDTYYHSGNLEKYSYKFLILDGTSLRMVNRYSDDPIDGIVDMSPRLTQIYTFEQRPLPQKVIVYPDERSYNELYKKKWLWEREEDWQRWMNEHAAGKGRR